MTNVHCYTENKLNTYAMQQSDTLNTALTIKDSNSWPVFQPASCPADVPVDQSVSQAQ